MPIETHSEVLHIRNLRGEILYTTPSGSLCDTDLRCVDLRNARLTGVNLTGADLRNANLRDADLRYATLCGTDLWGANLRDADLENSYLWSADFRGANLRDANLYKAYLRNADLRDARGLASARVYSQQLVTAHGNWVQFTADDLPDIIVKEWPILLAKDWIWVGCECRTIEHWRKISQDDLRNLGDQEVVDAYEQLSDTVFAKHEELYGG